MEDECVTEHALEEKMQTLTAKMNEKLCLDKMDEERTKWLVLLHQSGRLDASC